MVLDQAGWHGAVALRVPDCITLAPLPPYSPELNPVAWVWEYMTERFLSLRLLRLRRHCRRRMQGLEPPPRRDRPHHLALLHPWIMEVKP